MRCCKICNTSFLMVWNSLRLELGLYVIKDSSSFGSGNENGKEEGELEQ